MRASIERHWHAHANRPRDDLRARRPQIRYDLPRGSVSQYRRTPRESNGARPLISAREITVKQTRLLLTALQQLALESRFRRRSFARNAKDTFCARARTFDREQEDRNS